MTGHPRLDQPPRRRIATSWGELEASCIHPHRVSFSTARPTEPSTLLVINRVRYGFGATIRCAEVPLDRRHSVRFLDKRWYLDGARQWSLYRDGRRPESTESARALVRQRLLPELVKWLNGDEAAELVGDGAAYWRADCEDQAERTERQLLGAVDLLRTLRDRVASGHVVTDDEERYLRSLRVEVD